MSLSAVLENGRILIRDSMPSMDSPEEHVWYWGTRFDVHDLTDFVTGERDDPAKIEVQRFGPNAWSLRFPHCNFWADSAISPNTTAVRTETVPLTMPKVRRGIECKWRNGRWQKLLKSGWTDV